MAGCEGVLAAEGAVKTDFLWLDGDRETVLTARTLTEQVNRPDLVAGRLPEAADECVLDAERYGEERLGQTIRLASANDPDTLDAFAFREYTVVGLVRSPSIWIWTGAPPPWGTAR